MSQENGRKNASFVVTGGCGYVGSIVSDALLTRYPTAHLMLLDDLSRGHREVWRTLVKKHPKACVSLFVSDVKDQNAWSTLKDILKVGDTEPPVVFHMAALTDAAESTRQPGRYADVNCWGTASAMIGAATLDARCFVMSSTVAVYGEQETKNAVVERGAMFPTNPYGWSKLMAEKAVLRPQMKMERVVFRYSNVAGAVTDGDPSLWLGEDHSSGKCLIPSVIRCALSGETFHVAGDDYQTLDGSCVRDIVDVVDIARAHVMLVEKLDELSGTPHRVFNLGTERGQSVKQVVNCVDSFLYDTFGKLLLETDVVARRPGDAAFSVADCSLAKDVLGWEPKRSLEETIASAFDWHWSHCFGYASKNGLSRLLDPDGSRVLEHVREIFAFPDKESEAACLLSSLKHEETLGIHTYSECEICGFRSARGRVCASCLTKALAVLDKESR